MIANHLHPGVLRRPRVFKCHIIYSRDNLLENKIPPLTLFVVFLRSSATINKLTIIIQPLVIFLLIVYIAKVIL